SVLANDTDPDHGAVLSVASLPAKSAVGATLTINADGSISYDPTSSTHLRALAQGTSTVDTFRYRVLDQYGVGSWATVSVMVQGLNDAPVAVDCKVSAQANHAVTINVLAPDYDPDAGDTISLVGVDANSALGAVVTMNHDGTVVYDPTHVAALIALAK